MSKKKCDSIAAIICDEYPPKCQRKKGHTGMHSEKGHNNAIHGIGFWEIYWGGTE